MRELAETGQGLIRQEGEQGKVSQPPISLIRSRAFLTGKTAPGQVARKIKEARSESRMFPTLQRMSGYLWKIPYKMSQPQKARQRKRLKAVDSTIATVAAGLREQGLTINKLNFLDKAFPKEHEMPSRDKYWIFARYARNYRKGAHRQPKFTKLSNRTNPPGF